MKIISRAEAKARGLKRYFTGIPCVRGHVCERYIQGQCCQCMIEKVKAYDAAHPEQKRMRNDKHRRSEKGKAADLAYRRSERGREKARASFLKRYAANPEKFREKNRKKDRLRREYNRKRSYHYYRRLAAALALLRYLNIPMEMIDDFAG